MGQPPAIRPYSYSDPPAGFGPGPLPNLALEELAGLVAREVLDEVDRARPLVVGDAPAAPVDQLLIDGGRAGLNSHHRLNRLAPPIVGHSDDRHVAHGRVAVQA